MSTIISQLRTRYRVKLDRPTPDVSMCANSSQVRRVLALVMTPSNSLSSRARAHRQILLTTVLASVGICGALAHFFLASKTASVPSKPISVTTLVLNAPEPCTTRKEFLGKIQSARRSELGFDRSGRLTRVYVNEGDCVESGALLAELDSTSIESELALAKSELKLAGEKLRTLQSSQTMQPTVRRTRSGSSDSNLMSGGSATSARAQVEYWTAIVHQVESNLKHCQLRAPYKAVVAQVFLSDGSVVTADRPVVDIVGHDDLMVKVPMPVAYTDFLHSQASYQFVVGNNKLNGSLKALLPDGNAAEQTRDVLFLLPEISSASVGIGAQVCLNVDVPTRKTGYRVPKSAVQTQKDGSSVVAVVRAESQPTGSSGRTRATAHKQPVEVLQANGDWVIIRGKLNSGDRIVAVMSKQLLSSEQAVQFSDIAQWKVEAWLDLRARERQ